MIIWFGIEHWDYWFHIGLVGLIPSFIAAVYGYIGIFANRYSQVLSASERFKSSNNGD
ncbi:hypothetical protein [Marinifaba aquimaris]|uniref:hypothetical protein n=1 Tax=Marinifaba aquimaris TaxID=2741323 RepID=UPI001FE8E17E|nr:hypothetical protein [Marinifaba aquimaris]